MFLLWVSYPRNIHFHVILHVIFHHHCHSFLQLNTVICDFKILFSLHFHKPLVLALTYICSYVCMYVPTNICLHRAHPKASGHQARKHPTHPSPTWTTLHSRRSARLHHRHRHVPHQRPQRPAHKLCGRHSHHRVAVVKNFVRYVSNHQHCHAVTSCRKITNKVHSKYRHPGVRALQLPRMVRAHMQRHRHVPLTVIRILVRQQQQSVRLVARIIVTPYRLNRHCWIKWARDGVRVLRIKLKVWVVEILTVHYYMHTVSLNVIVIVIVVVLCCVISLLNHFSFLVFIIVKCELLHLRDHKSLTRQAYRQTRVTHTYTHSYAGTWNAVESFKFFRFGCMRESVKIWLLCEPLKTLFIATLCSATFKSVF